MKRIGVATLWVIEIYFVARALAEPFVIDVNDPATYRHDWGGPHLAGVLLVHCGLNVVAAALMAWRLMRRSSRRLRRRMPERPAGRDADRPGPPERDGHRRTAPAADRPG
jgi:hypothetical protein